VTQQVQGQMAFGTVLRGSTYGGVAVEKKAMGAGTRRGVQVESVRPFLYYEAPVLDVAVRRASGGRRWAGGRVASTRSTIMVVFGSCVHVQGVPRHAGAFSGDRAGAGYDGANARQGLGGGHRVQDGALSGGWER